MTPKERNLLDALNLLTLLFRAQKQTFPALSDEQRHTLKITKEHLAEAQISIPVFSNTLNTLSEKGYLFAITIFEDKQHLEVQKALSDGSYTEMLKKLESLDTKPFMQKLKEGVGDVFEKIKPANMGLDRKGFMEEDISLTSLISDGFSVFAGHTTDDVAIVILLPFRDIERLLEKMNSGMKFDEVQDVGIWYNPATYDFHFGDEVVNTSYRGNPSKAHYVLDTLFNKSNDSVIEYSEISEFNDTHNRTKETRAFNDSIRLFISKHPKLNEIFKAYSDRLEIQEKYKNDTH